MGSIKCPLNTPHNLPRDVWQRGPEAQLTIAGIGYVHDRLQSGQYSMDQILEDDRYYKIVAQSVSRIFNGVVWRYEGPLPDALALSGVAMNLVNRLAQPDFTEVPPIESSSIALGKEPNPEQQYTHFTSLQEVHSEALTTSVEACFYAGAAALAAHSTTETQKEETKNLQLSETAAIIQSDEVTRLLKSLARAPLGYWAVTGETLAETGGDSRTVLTNKNIFFRKRTIDTAWLNPAKVIDPETLQLAKEVKLTINERRASYNEEMSLAVNERKMTSSGCPALIRRTDEAQPLDSLTPEQQRYLLESGLYIREGRRLKQIRSPFKMAQSIAAQALIAANRYFASLS